MSSLKFECSMDATMIDTAQWLHEYFIQQGSLTLPGVGTFRIQRISAQVDFASKRMMPPSFTIRFDHRYDTPHREMFAYVSQRSGMADWESVRSVNNLAFDIKTRLLHGESVPIEGIGILRPDNGSGFQFDGKRINYDFILKVRANRVIRKDAEHTVRVGELHRSSSEMEEFLHAHDEPVPMYQRMLFRATILALCALLLFSMRFFNPTDSGFSVRQDLVHPAETAPTYSTIKAP